MSSAKTLQNEDENDVKLRNKTKPIVFLYLENPLLLIDVKEFACGWGAAFINITVTYPIYKIIFRQVIINI